MVQGINTLMAWITTLSQGVITLTDTSRTINSHTRPINIVKKPKALKGKTSEEAYLFCSTFTVWVHDHDVAFVSRDPTTGTIIMANGRTVYNGRKMISLALSFMISNAAIWAHPHLEKITDNADVFVVTDDQCNILHKNN